MSASVQLVGADALRKRFANYPQRVTKAAAEHIHRKEAAPAAVHMRQRAGGQRGLAGRSASTIRVSKLSDGAELRAGGDGSLGSVTLFGNEFGARGKRRVSYVTHSRSGTPYIVTRRTTRQFRPFLAGRGYFVFPTLRADLRGLRTRIADLMWKVANDG